MVFDTAPYYPVWDWELAARDWINDRNSAEFSRPASSKVDGIFGAELFNFTTIFGD